MKFQHLHLFCTLIVTTFFSRLPATAQQPEDFPEETWISSVAWLNDAEVIGSKSQGLLVRPGEVVQASVDELQKPKTLGTAKTSLWRVLPVEEQILASDYDGRIHIFGREEPAQFETESKWIRALTPAPARDSDDVGAEILAGTEDGELIVLSLEEGKELRRIDAHDAQIFDIALHPRGNQVATAGGEGEIRVFSWPELKPLGKMSRGNQSIWSLLYSTDGKRIISGGAGNRIQLWDAESYESVCTIARARDWITDLILLPDTSLIVAGCMDGKLVICDYETLVPVDRLTVAESPIWSIALSPDSTRIAVGTRKHGFVLTEVGDWEKKSADLATELDKLQPPKPNLD